MTLRELSQLYWLRKEITVNQRRLDELRGRAASIPAGVGDGIPRGSGEHRPVEELAVEIADLCALIRIRQRQCVREKIRLERYIAGIEDSLTRQIFRLRFVDGLRWEEVAARIGGVSEHSVKKTCYRHLRRKEGMNKV